MNTRLSEIVTNDNKPITMDEYLGGDLKPSDATLSPSRHNSPSARKRPNRSGMANPFHGHTHTPESKAKMSRTQRARYQMLRNNLKDEARVNSAIRLIIREELLKELQRRQ